MGTPEQRLTALEQHVYRLTHRVSDLESRLAWLGPPTAYRPPAPAPAPAGWREAPAPDPRDPVARGSRLASLPAGWLLAAAGGAVLLAGVGFLLRFAAAAGWLGPTTRVTLAAAGSMALAAAGLRLATRPATRTVGQICTATGAAGAYAAVVAATAGYDLVPAVPGLLLAAAVSAATVAYGLATRCQPIAALGVCAALGTTVVVGAPASGLTLGFVVVALAGALAAAAYSRWVGLAVLAFAVSAPQLGRAAVAIESVPLALGLLGLTASMLVASAHVHARSGGRWTEVTAAGLAAAAGVFAAAVGWAAVEAHASSPVPLSGWWVAAVAGAYVATAVSVTPTLRVWSTIVLTVGVLLGDAAAALLTDGLPVTAVFAAVAVVLAAATRTRRAALAVTALQMQLIVVGLRALADTGQVAAGGGASLGYVAGLIAVAAAVAGLLVAAPALRRAAAGTYVAAAVLHLVTVEAPLTALLDGTDTLGSALAAALLIVAGCLWLGWRHDRWFTRTAVIVANYAASIVAVAADPHGAGRIALTALWSTAGAAGLLAGRRLASADLRRAGVALLAAAVTKAVVVDATTLSGTHRAVALLLCGGVLVATAVAEARGAGSQANRKPRSSPTAG